MPASSRARSRPPAWVPRRRTTTAMLPQGTPSSTSRRRRGGLLDQAGEVHQPLVVQPLLVPLEEVRQLVPSRRPGGLRPLADLLRLEQRLLGPEHELPDLVREPPQTEHRAVRRPPGG